MPETYLSKCRVMVVADFDSFLKAAIAYAEPLREFGSSVEVRVASTLPGQLSQDQIATAFLSETPKNKKISAIAKESIDEDFDVVILCLNGLRTRKFFAVFNEMAERSDLRRPVVVTGYPGIIFRYHLTGLMDRSSADLFCINSVADFDLYESGCKALNLSPANALVTGLSVTWKRDQSNLEDISRNAVVFFDQPTVPSTYSQRRYVISCLIALANRIPSKQVIVKPRHRPSETSIHLMSYHLHDLLAMEKNVPKNLRIEYGRTDQILQKACLVLTFSSTAAIEAMISGIPTRILTDLGVGEDTGVHFFTSCGCLAAFSDIEDNMPDCVDRDWLSAVSGPRNGRELYLARLHQLLSERKKQGGRLSVRQLYPATGSAEWHEYAARQFGFSTALQPSRGYPFQFVRFHSRLALRYAVRSLFSR